MAHDYAKKPRASAKRTPKPSSPVRARKSNPAPVRTKAAVPAWLWLLVGVAVGAFVMFLIRLTDVKVPDKTVEAQPKIVKSQPSIKVAPAAAKAEKPKEKPVEEPQEAQAPEKPRFDFYQMLKENEVPVVLSPEDEALAKNKPPERIFILQVASFRKAEDAEELRIKLLLLNLDARTEEVTVRNGEKWHRVLTGPFNSRSELSKARSTLISNGHQALVMEHKKTAAK